MAVWLWWWPATGLADDDCIACHKQFATVMAGKPAKAIGCVQCHSELDGRVLPHRSTAGFPKGLPAAADASCLACHRKDAYTRLVHGTLGGGCTGCHDTHAVKHGKPRVADTADLCYRCHARSAMVDRVTHKPVAGGDCADCHEMHAAEHKGLLTNPPTELCVSCHRKVKKMPHGTATLPAEHPTGVEANTLDDLTRSDHRFQCVSCHDPHRSQRIKLLKFDLHEPTGFCVRCHPL